jgi:hypothetical protein
MVRIESLLESSPTQILLLQQHVVDPRSSPHRDPRLVEPFHVGDALRARHLPRPQVLDEETRLRIGPQRPLEKVAQAHGVHLDPVLDELRYEGLGQPCAELGFVASTGEKTAPLAGCPAWSSSASARDHGDLPFHWRTPSGSELKAGAALKSLIDAGALQTGYGVYTGTLELKDGPLRVLPLTRFLGELASGALLVGLGGRSRNAAP